MNVVAGMIWSGFNISNGWFGISGLALALAARHGIQFVGAVTVLDHSKSELGCDWSSEGTVKKLILNFCD